MSAQVTAMIATLAEPNYAEPKTVGTPKIPPVTYAIYRLPKAQVTRRCLGADQKNAGPSRRIARRPHLTPSRPVTTVSTY
ncbi:hypothetical protein FRAHR75_1240012 [Frankia sp. Hr75.2]|nr:hypothetical protein FRAHR75_1240012 [Frankia sp. Hr75.2]